MIMFMDRQLEKHLHIKVCDYIRTVYPDTMFRTDLGGIKLTMGQAIQAKRMNGGKRAWPDLFIASQRAGFGGLFIELKSKEIYKKGGLELLKNSHVEEQQAMLERLTQAGYCAVFAVGFEDAKLVIDNYLSKQSGV